MPMPSLTRHDINGVPAYVSDIHTSFTGTLVFGVGLRDETARTAGTAHLLEHLVMSRVGRVAISHNATTADESLSFFAQGSPSLVCDFLTRVADAISTIHETTESDVIEQRRIIAAELGESDETPGRGPLLNRFGAHSLGLLDLGSPAHRSLTLEDALAFADAWLHAGNAVLTFTGDIPTGMSIELPPARTIPPRSSPAILPLRTTGWMVDGGAPLTVSMLLGPAPRPTMALAGSLIAEAIHSELRTGRQKIYSVSPFVAATEADTRFVAYVLDPRTEDAVEASVETVRVLDELAQNGPTEEQLSEEADRWVYAADDPAEQVGALDGFAVAILRGRRDPADLEQPDVKGVTVDEVRAVVSAARPTLFVTFADGTVPEGDPETTAALGLPFSADTDAFVSSLSRTQLTLHLARSGVSLFTPKLFRGLAGWNLAIDHERMTYLHPQERPLEMRFADIVLANYADSDRQWNFLSGAGRELSVGLEHWRNAKHLHRLLEERVPSRSRFLSAH